jgi:hypothetical protein
VRWTGAREELVTDSRVVAVGAQVPPRTETESRICEIWEGILGRRVQDVTAPFTDLGGNSIAAARITARIRVHLGVALDLSAILRLRSVRALASSIDAARRPVPTSAEAVLAPVPHRDGLPMSFFQEWRFRADDGRTAPLYTIALGYELRGPVNLSALNDAISELVRRHEPLRTNYALADSRPVQVIHPPGAVDLPVLDVRGSPEERRRDEALRLLEEQAARPVDRRNGSVFQPVLAQFADDAYLLLLRLDRIAVDGTSCQLLEEDLTMLYARALEGSDFPDPPVLQQADWAHWQRQLLRGDRLDRLVAYWRRTLDGSRPLLELRLPSAFSSPATPSFRGRSEHRRLGLDLSRELRRRAREADVTLFMYVLTALSTFIGRLAGRQEATVLCPYANRTRPELERVVGCFSHGVVYRMDLSGEPLFSELVTRVRDVCLETWEHLELPISEVARYVRPSSYLTLYDEFHVFFDVVRDVPILQLSGVEVAPTFIGTGAAHPSLAVLIDEGAEDLGLIMRAASDRFDAAALGWTIDEFTRLLDAAVRDPVRPVADLPPSPESVRRRFGS